MNPNDLERYKFIIKKYSKYLKNLNTPLIATIIIALSGGFIYVCGNLFLNSYLLGSNYNFMDFLIDPLPLQYGHLIGTGFIVYLITLSLVAIILVFQLQIENRKMFKVLILLMILSAIGFLSTNLLNASNHVNYTGLIVLGSILFIYFMISILLTAINNLQIGIPAFLYWCCTVIYLDQTDSLIILKEFLTLPFLGYMFFCIIFGVLVFIFNKLKVFKLKMIIILTPIIFLLLLILIILINKSQIYSFDNYIHIRYTFGISLVLSILLAFIIKSDLNLRIFSTNKLLHEFWDDLKKVSLVLKVAFSLIFLGGFIPGLMITFGGLLNEFTQIETQTLYIYKNETVVDQKPSSFSGRYIGEKNGLHYYIHDDELHRTQEIIDIKH